MKYLNVLIKYLKIIDRFIRRHRQKLSGSSKIRTKLIAAFILPVVFIIALGFISYLKSSGAVLKIAEESTSATMDGSMKYLDAVFSNISNMSLQLINDKDIQDYLNDSLIDKGSYEFIQIKQKVQKRITTLSLSYNMISDVFIIAEGSNSILPNGYSNLNLESLKNTEFEKRINAVIGSAIWTGYHHDLDKIGLAAAKMNDTSVKYSVSLVRALRSTATGYINAYLVIDLKYEFIINFLNGIKENLPKGSELHLITSDDRDLYAIKPEDEPESNLITDQEFFGKIKTSGESKGSNIVKYKGKEYLATYTEIPGMAYILIGLIPQRELNTSSHDIAVLTIILVILSVLVSLSIGLYMATGMGKTISQIIYAAGRTASGDLSVSLKSRRTDELGILTNSINSMIGRISELLDKVKNDQKKKREYELALIQSQIKPHFLYNTLDLIFVLCEMGEAGKASDTTKALADFYRISLSKGREIISIQEEMKNARDYLFIQKERYSDILDFNIEVSKDIMNYSILKLTIQPLIENAVYHGIKPKGGQGKVLIQGYEEEDAIILKVIDDGIGIPEEKLDILFNSSNDNISAQSFGLKSVDERIKLYFGEEYGLKIKSEQGTGTEITVVIPKKAGIVKNA